MSNCYYDATGTLKLKEITPVIKALFGVFCVEKYDDTTAYIKQESEGNSVNYDCMIGEISDEMEIDPSDTADAMLIAMAEKLGKKDEVAALLGEGQLDPNQDADITFLFNLAQIMDDGHGLTEIEMEGAWHGSKMRLGNFGGSGEYVGKRFVLYTSSSQAARTGQTISKLIAEANLAAVAEELRKQFEQVLSGISDDKARAEVRTFIINEWQRK